MSLVSCHSPPHPHSSLQTKPAAAASTLPSAFPSSGFQRGPSCKYLDNQLWSHSLGAEEQLQHVFDFNLEFKPCKLHLFSTLLKAGLNWGLWIWAHRALETVTFMMTSSSFETFLPGWSPEKKNRVHQSWSFRGATEIVHWWGYPRWISGWTSALPSFHLFSAAVWDLCFTADLKFPLVLQPGVQGSSYVCASPFTHPGDLPGARLCTRTQSGCT